MVNGVIEIVCDVSKDIQCILQQGKVPISFLYHSYVKGIGSATLYQHTL